MTFEVTIAQKVMRVELSRSREGGWACRVDGEAVELDVVSPGADAVSLLLNGRSFDVTRVSLGGEPHVLVNGSRYPVEVRDPRALRGRRGAGGSDKGPRKVTAPMPGKVVRVLAGEGTEVEAGQGVIVIEAMKMQNELRSPKKGRVQKVAAAEGAAVNPGDVLVVVE